MRQKTIAGKKHYKDMRLESSILAVADIVETTVSHRTHSLAFGINKAPREIPHHRWFLYNSDTAYVDTCLKDPKEKISA